MATKRELESLVDILEQERSATAIQLAKAEAFFLEEQQRAEALANRVADQAAEIVRLKYEVAELVAAGALERRLH